MGVLAFAPNVGQCPRSTCPDLISQLFQNRSQLTWPGDALRKRQSQCGLALLQFEAFRIDADATPVSVRSAEQPRRIQATGICVVCVDVRDCVGRGLDERLSKIGRASCREWRG